MLEDFGIRKMVRIASEARYSSLQYLLCKKRDLHAWESNENISKTVENVKTEHI